MQPPQPLVTGPSNEGYIDPLELRLICRDGGGDGDGDSDEDGDGDGDGDGYGDCDVDSGADEVSGLGMEANARSTSRCDGLCTSKFVEIIHD